MPEKVQNRPRPNLSKAEWGTYSNNNKPYRRWWFDSPYPPLRAHWGAQLFEDATGWHLRLMGDFGEHRQLTPAEARDLFETPPAPFGPAAKVYMGIQQVSRRALRLSDAQHAMGLDIPVLDTIMKAFIDQIPKELDESAIIDGANALRILWHVVLPLAAPGMIAASTFVLVFSWNEFLFAFIFTTTEAKTTPLILSEMLGALDGVEWGVLFAAATLQLLPVLAFVMLVQKAVIAGMTAGSVKG